MSEPLNFCRQIVRDLGGMPPSFAKKDPIKFAQIVNVLRMIKAAQKFMLPKSGRMLDDPNYRGLEAGARIALPFDVVALEYEPQPGVGDNDLPPGFPRVGKTVVLLEQDETHIYMQPVWWRIDAPSGWVMPWEVCIPRDDNALDGVAGRQFVIQAREGSPFKIRDYQDEVGALMGVLNALNCANVRIERVARKSDGRAIKAAIPFDTYHVLTVASASHEITGHHHEGRSPREHLRRGHIRRLGDGRKVWVNATVVNAGVGGKVAKDYAMEAA